MSLDSGFNFTLHYGLQVRIFARLAFMKQEEKWYCYGDLGLSVGYYFHDKKHKKLDYNEESVIEPVCY